MTSRQFSKPSDLIRLSGWTTVDGVSVEVHLTVDTVALIHWLGAKACRSVRGRATDAKGDVVARVSKSAVLAVRKPRPRRESRITGKHCADCGAGGVETGHMGCLYPGSRVPT